MHNLYKYLIVFSLFFVAHEVAKSQVIINEVLADPPSDLVGDANGDGVRESFSDEFVEIVNSGSTIIDISGWTVSDDDTPTANLFTFPPNTMIDPGEGVVVFGGGIPGASCCGGSQVFTNEVDDGIDDNDRIGSGLRNGGDVVELRNANGDLVDSFAYGDQAGDVLDGGDNQSLTRSPDVSGGFELHTVADVTDGSVFSPGTTIDGSTAFPTVSGNITINESLIEFIVDIGAPSPSQMFTIEAIGLTQDIVISAPDNYEISLDDASFNSELTLNQSGGTVSLTNVFVRLIGDFIGFPNGQISISSSASPVSIDVSGAVNINPANIPSLSPGDISFIAFNADSLDDFAIVTFVDLAADQYILFTDQELDGSGQGFPEGEGDLAWSTGNSGVPAGSVVIFNDVSDEESISVNIGFVNTQNTLGLSSSGEGVFAYTGPNFRTDPSLIAAIGTDSESNSFGTLAGSGLQIGTSAILLTPSDLDIAEYVGPRTGIGLAGFISALNDASNYNIQDGSGNQSNDGIDPDLPFDATSFDLTVQVDEPEIVISQGNSTINNGGDLQLPPASIGAFSELTLSLENIGTATLEITESVIIGANAAEFTLQDNIPDSIEAGQTADFIIRFSPSAAGERQASLTITSNDTDESNFAIILLGTGQAGGMAQGFELLITEVSVTPNSGEFVEIFNPNDQPVDLTNIYITDATLSNDPRYINIVDPETNFPGGGSNTDFHARFPAGAMIMPGEYQTIATNATGSEGFLNTLGVLPTYEMREDADSPDNIPDMLPAFPGSIDTVGNTQLSNGGEVIILYFWDGESDLVQDLDYVVWGDGVEASDKTGLSIDGPDVDSETTEYLAETPLVLQQVVSTETHPTGESFQRIDLTEGQEVQMGSNGILGDDETSENLATTFGVGTVSPNAAASDDVTPAGLPEAQPTIITNPGFLDFGTLEPNESVDLTYSVSGANLLGENLIIAADGRFSLSLDGVNFSDSLAIPINADSTVTQQTVTVRFNPISGILNLYSDDIIHTSSNTVTDITVVGRENGPDAPINDNAFKVVAWNVIFFGDDGNSLDDPTQVANTIAVIDSLNADIIAFQEIVDENDFNQVVDNLPGFDGILADFAANVNLRLGFIWDTTTVQPLDFRVLLEEAASGVTGRSFFAGGRVPFLMDAIVDIDGMEMPLSVVNIHANAGNGDYFNRVDDIALLLDTLNTFFSDRNIIFLGDYNDDVDIATTTDADGTVRPSPYVDFTNDPDNWNVVTIALSNDAIITREGSNTPIDHVTISNELNEFLVSGSARTEFGAAFSVGDFNSTTSDHFPVSIQLSVPEIVVPDIAVQIGSTTIQPGDTVLFNSQEIGEAEEVILTVENMGLSTLIFNDISISGEDASEFEILGDVPGSLDNGQSDNITVAFAPTALGTRVASLTFNSNDDDESEFTINLVGEGTSVITSVDNAEEFNFVVYPNPSTGIFQVNLGTLAGQSLAYTVMDITGKVIVNGEFTQNRVVENIDLSNIDNGVYLIQFENASTTIIERILIRR